jgi:hypothetical protein
MRKDEYLTNDLYLSSFLISLGEFKLKEVKGSGSNRKVFVIEPRPEESLILKFYSGAATVSALKLLESLQSLKAACYVLGNKRETEHAFRS